MGSVAHSRLVDETHVSHIFRFIVGKYFTVDFPYRFSFFFFHRFKSIRLEWYLLCCVQYLYLDLSLRYEWSGLKKQGIKWRMWLKRVAHTNVHCKKVRKISIKMNIICHCPNRDSKCVAFSWLIIHAHSDSHSMSSTYTRLVHRPHTQNLCRIYWIKSTKENIPLLAIIIIV